MLRRLVKKRVEPQVTELERAEAARAYATRLFTEAREELNRADAKAQVLLGVAGIGLGAVAGGLLAGSWSPFELSDTVEWLWWAGILAALAALSCLTGAVYPRTGKTKSNKPGYIGYYGDVLRFDSNEATIAALSRSSVLDLERTTDQIRRLSRIIERKYQLIRWGFWLLLKAIVLTLGAIMINLTL
ncbi:Pycsar system effector family protein [Streptosporangium sp. V21-05]|uniref:Pycsar system effector family protein n=1 Tax=Streptosporangium sp. V21-05 TaxID=3446115 RepID=UPI003F52F10D